MYEIDKGWWFVPKALNKFTVSLRDNLKPNAGWFAYALFPARLAGQL